MLRLLVFGIFQDCDQSHHVVYTGWQKILATIVKVNTALPIQTVRDSGKPN